MEVTLNNKAFCSGSAWIFLKMEESQSLWNPLGDPKIKYPNVVSPFWPNERTVMKFNLRHAKPL